MLRQAYVRVTDTPPGFEESNSPGLLSGRRNFTAKPSPLSRGAQCSFKCNGPEGEDKGEGELQSDVTKVIPFDMSRPSLKPCLITHQGGKV